jgi:phage terminase large subunit
MKKIELFSYQYKAITSSKKIIAFIAGTGAGKSFTIPSFIIAKNYNLTNRIIIVSAPSYKMLKRVALEYIVTFFNKLNIKFVLNKSELSFKTHFGMIYCISADDPNAMQGIVANCIIGDESGLFDKSWLDVAIQRTSFTGGQILLTTTPYSSNWLLDVYNDETGDVEVIKVSSRDNPLFPKAEIQRAKERLPPWKFKMLYEADFTTPSGKIYSEVTYAERFNYNGSFTFCGLDFGYNNPTAYIKVAEIGDVFYVVECWKESELTIDGIDKKLQKTNDIIYGDPASKDTLETLKERGYRIRTANKEVLGGIFFLESLFYQKKLIVFDDLKILKDEIDNYTWKLDRRGEQVDAPKKENDHLLDALRYAIYSYQPNLPVKGYKINL